MSRAFRAALTVATGVVLAAGGCSPTPSGAGAGTDRAGCIEDFDPAVDYFPDKSTVSDATNFTLSYHGSYQVLTVAQPYPGGRPASYLLVRCGAPAPQLTGELAAAPQISVPVTSLYSASTTHLGLLDELHQTGVVTGVADAADVVNPAVLNRIDTGRAVQYAPDGQLDVEAVIAGQPDVLVTGGYDDPGYAKLAAAGVVVVANGEWLEDTPLGRAEWIKVFAALTGTERRAAERYATVRGDYQNTVARAAERAPVDVLIGTMYQGSWSMPTGADFTGRLVTDAGGVYPWVGHTGGLQLSFESVYAETGQAPLWLVADDWRTLADVLSADSRYGQLAAVRDGRVWSATKVLGPGGGNDYWERGVARPDLVLADLVAILHPDLEPDHAFAFYRRVPRS